MISTISKRSWQLVWLWRSASPYAEFFKSPEAA